MTTTIPRTTEGYFDAFRLERAETYPAVDAFEAEMGYAIPDWRLADAARVLACPLKVHPPNWQHGRVIYAAYRAHLAGVTQPVLVLDIGTAKGFSALCAQWALIDSGVLGRVVSVDVIDPHAAVLRNTVAECDGLKTLAELHAKWPEASAIQFKKQTGLDWLTSGTDRVDMAFIDGKHTADVVWKEALSLAVRQRPGDLVIFDDLHLPLLREAVSRVSLYALDVLTISPLRAYGIGRRR